MSSRKIFSLLLIVSLFLTPIFLCIVPTTNIVTDVVVLEGKQGAGGQGQYVVVPITVYQVEGSTITPQQVQDLLARLNRLHNCEVVVYVWNGIILPLDDPDRGHGSGPNATGDIEYPEAGDDGENTNLTNAVNNHSMNPTFKNKTLFIFLVNGTRYAVGGWRYVVAKERDRDREWERELRPLA